MYGAAIEMKANYGDNIEYNVTVWNTDSVNATDVVVTDYLPSEVEVIESTINDNGVYDSVNRTITWTVNLTVSQTKSFTYNVTVLGYGLITTNVTVSNHAANKTIYVRYCDVAIEITAPDKVHTGDEFDIVVNVINYGPDVAENVTDILNITGAEINILDIYSTNGTNFTNGTWIIGNLPMGEIVTIVLHVKAIQEGTLLITGIVSTITYDTNLLNNIDNATVIIEDNNQSNPVTPDYNINMLPTGNPLLVLLCVLLVIPFVRLKFKK